MTVRRRRIRVALAIAGAVIAVVAMLVAGAWTALPSWLQGKVEQAASNALGRALTIGGPLEIEFGRAPRITATDVALQNAAWGSERSMVHAERVTVVLDLASLGSGPLRVREVEIEGARLSLEGDGTGGGNWSFASTASPRRSSPPPPVVFDRAAIRGLELVVRPRPEATPIEVEIQELQAKPDPGGTSSPSTAAAVTRSRLGSLQAGSARSRILSPAARSMASSPAASARRSSAFAGSENRTSI